MSIRKLCGYGKEKGLIQPNRQGYQRRYLNEDLKRLKFIKYLIDEKGLNIAGVKHIISMYPCWTKKNCKGGARKNSPVPINETKPCWKLEGTYCMIALDKAEVCNTCEFYRNCTNCDGCRNS